MLCWASCAWRGLCWRVSRFFKKQVDGEIGHLYWIGPDGKSRDAGRWTEEDVKILALVCEQAAAQGLNKRRVTALAVTRARGLAMKLWSVVKG